MALVQKVQDIIEKAKGIQELAFYSRPAEYEKLVSDSIVPVLLEIAAFVDSVTPNEEENGQKTELVSVADALNEFQHQLTTISRQNAEIIVENQKLKQEIGTLKSRVTVLSKTKAVA